MVAAVRDECHLHSSIFAQIALTFLAAGRYRSRGASRHCIVPPAVFLARPLFVPASTSSDGPAASRIYTPAMRRWVCTVALLAGFVGEENLRGFRLRQPVAIVRLIDPRREPTHGLVPTGAWWTRRPG